MAAIRAWVAGAAGRGAGRRRRTAGIRAAGYGQLHTLSHLRRTGSRRIIQVDVRLVGLDMGVGRTEQAGARDSASGGDGP